VATITSDGDEYANEVVRALDKAGLRVNPDLRNEKITYKVREHSLAKVPVLVVVGKKEAAERTVSIRRLGSPNQTAMSLDEALRVLVAEAVTPDLRRAAEAVSEPEGHATLDGHHVVARTVA
jgi:threonyl-tRNA synthetase